MLAYVFWHWKQPEVGAGDYESRQRAFHEALAAQPIAGFHGSSSAALHGAPWAANGGDAWEDWYLVDDFASLGVLNEAAVSAGRTLAHDEAAAVAADGAGGVYALKLGADQPASIATWFAKPAGMRYDELFGALGPIVEASEAALWMRQMVLGPGRELCLRSSRPVELPDGFDALVIPLRAVWTG